MQESRRVGFKNQLKIIYMYLAGLVLGLVSQQIGVDKNTFYL